MRITAGELRGRIVKCPPGEIRPAMDRMRESVFAALGDLSGLSFLDLFSGSGVIALEACSRGALPVVAVERDRRKRAVILANFELAPVPPRLVITPVERFVASARDPFDLLFLDPPFDYRYKVDLLERIERSPLVRSGARLLIHYPHPERLPDEVGALRRTDERKYGRSRVAFYRRDA